MDQKHLRMENDGRNRASHVTSNQNLDTYDDDERHVNQIAMQKVSKKTSVSTVANTRNAHPSAAMDAVVRLITGKEERRIVDRINDPNRPTWEEFKKDRANTKELSHVSEMDMKKYRKQLDMERERRLSGQLSSSSKKKKKKKRKQYTTSSSEDEFDKDERKSIRKRHKSTRLLKKTRKRKRSLSNSSDSSTNDSHTSNENNKSHKLKKKKKKKFSEEKKGRKKSRDTINSRTRSSSPVRLSNFFRQD